MMIEVVWDKLKPLLEKAESRLPEYEQVNVDCFIERLQQGEWVLLIAVDGPDILATSILKRDINIKNAIEVSSVGGDKILEWADAMVNEIIAITLESGCIEFTGYSDRKGWIKYMSRYGAEVIPGDELTGYKVEVKNG